MRQEATSEIDAVTCLNCKAAAVGQACQACGQKRIPPDATSLRHVAGTLVAETQELDGRLPRTLLNLLFHLGRLTVDCLDGRRQRHIRPIPLCLARRAHFFSSTTMSRSIWPGWFPISRRTASSCNLWTGRPGTPAKPGSSSWPSGIRATWRPTSRPARSWTWGAWVPPCSCSTDAAGSSRRSTW
ncbi:MAG: DUF3667 domain-containing protein [Acidobacteria bacterium]|nr:DUF3667 domain-containing protein [Acidobacteriota bacterium]